MANDKLKELGPLFGEIGAAGTAIVGGDPDGLFIYIEIQDYSVYGAVFKDEGTQVRYFDPDDALYELVLDAWETEPEGKRWLVLEYDVRGRKFDVNLRYPEQVDPKSDSMDRRQAALDKRYGSKPIIYPPIPDHFRELK